MSRRPPAPLRLRRAPHVVCYWAGTRLVHHNFATGTGVAGGPRATELLHIFDEWRSIEEVAERLPQWDVRTLRRAVADLTRSGLLTRSDRKPPSSEQRLDDWRGWNPAAGFFHQTTKNVDYRLPTGPHAPDASTPAPAAPAFKHVSSSTVIQLPAERRNGELPDILTARRTWRTFSKAPLARQDLATLMGLTWRVQQWVPTVQGGRVALRTSPSGGACHPLEASRGGPSRPGCGTWSVSLFPRAPHPVADAGRRHGTRRRAISGRPVVVPGGRGPRLYQRGVRTQAAAIHLRARLPVHPRGGRTLLPDVLPGRDVVATGTVLHDGVSRLDWWRRRSASTASVSRCSMSPGVEGVPREPAERLRLPGIISFD